MLHKKTKRSHTIPTYDSHTTGSDIHLRSFVSGLYLLSIIFICYCTLIGIQRVVERCATYDDYCERSGSNFETGYHCACWSLTSTKYGVSYAFLSMRLLLLGGYIETNPGP